MYVRDILLRVNHQHNIVVFDSGNTYLIGRNNQGRFVYELRRDYPVFASPDIIRNWQVNWNVNMVLELNGAVTFIEGYNAGFDRHVN